MTYYVDGTYRENDCDENSAIKGLKLSALFNGFTMHDLKDLKQLADLGMLWVNVATYPVRVRIYWSETYRQYVATTRADGIQCNNLLSLPIYYPSSKNGTTVNFAQCTL